MQIVLLHPCLDSYLESLAQAKFVGAVRTNPEPADGRPASQAEYAMRSKRKHETAKPEWLHVSRGFKGRSVANHIMH